MKNKPNKNIKQLDALKEQIEKNLKYFEELKKYYAKLDQFILELAEITTQLVDEKSIINSNPPVSKKAKKPTTQKVKTYQKKTKSGIPTEVDEDVMSGFGDFAS